jgi:hypothetical protein
VHPVLDAMTLIAAQPEACSPRCSNTLRTTRDRASGEYLALRVIAPSLQDQRPPANLVRILRAPGIAPVIKIDVPVELSMPVTRAVAALEDRLGARLFNRTTRSLAITDVGRRFLERARRVLADLDAAEKEAVGEAAAPRGHLAITASVT